MARKNIGNSSLFDSALSNHKVMHDFDDIYKLVDWGKIEALLACVHSSSCGGTSYPPLIKFRAMLLQVWHKLSDPEAEKQLYRDLLFRRFCGLSLMDDVPDHSTISRFRNHLIAKGGAPFGLDRNEDSLREFLSLSLRTATTSTLLSQ